MPRTSRIAGFYHLSPDERLKKVAEFASLTNEEAQTIRSGGLDITTASRMIENVVGLFPLPLGIAANFLINGVDYLVPMAIEEPSVVAAASNAAKMARDGGGVHSFQGQQLMMGQVQLVNVPNPYAAKMEILRSKDEIISAANERDPVLVNLGGGAKDVEVRVVQTELGPMVIVHLVVDVKDAMGANAVNTMCEAVAPMLARISGGSFRLRIISNLADKRLVRAYALVPAKSVGGEEVARGIVEAYHFAKADPYRAATHNKGIMNGIDAVAIATGNDWRALEAGAHAYASRTGRYEPLTVWEQMPNGDLHGSIEVPLAVGIVGGATRTNPVAKLSLKILGVKTARELAEVMAAVGLVQNLAALRALAAEGIQAGHMSLHAKNIAVMAGAVGDEIDMVAESMVREKTIRVDRAEEILSEIRARRRT
ncbi:MAG: hydroxymethylglutaryl-CoA reductase, degradative [Candidatus Caldarchaeum sp.]|nr:hydroxymethylglutaryl-CoA reductase, degradative [Candidatus Caldarchaeum sp.]MDW7977984.1 hydroxymethylglutaryl-CoA reductase, degradative [Candidatus Caldarchaeum sp.]MDW8359788.1 hydroxymethylglutaryl-CoA reductase, degradative [Candidatus Caldarchaeum sp.]